MTTQIARPRRAAPADYRIVRDRRDGTTKLTIPAPGAGETFAARVVRLAAQYWLAGGELTRRDGAWYAASQRREADGQPAASYLLEWAGGDRLPECGCGVDGLCAHRAALLCAAFGAGTTTSCPVCGAGVLVYANAGGQGAARCPACSWHADLSRAEARAVYRARYDDGPAVDLPALLAAHGDRGARQVGLGPILAWRRAVVDAGGAELDLFGD